MEQFLAIFVVSLLLNIFWEEAHARLYLQYKSGQITHFILARASVWDAVYITLFALLFSQSYFFMEHTWLILPLGFLLSFLIEWYALRTHRWQYKETMPIIPLLHVGLTPVVQLGLLGYLTFWLVGF